MWFILLLNTAHSVISITYYEEHMAIFESQGTKNDI